MRSFEIKVASEYGSSEGLLSDALQAASEVEN